MIVVIPEGPVVGMPAMPGLYALRVSTTFSAPVGRADAGFPARVASVANELLPLSTEQAAGWVRAHLDELEARFAS